jgi:hypothetical protein
MSGKEKHRGGRKINRSRARLKGAITAQREPWQIKPGQTRETGDFALNHDKILPDGNLDETFTPKVVSVPTVSNRRDSPQLNFPTRHLSSPRIGAE